MTRDELIAHLEQNTKVLHDSLIRGAFVAVDRSDFVSPKNRDEAYEDYPVSIGHGQTISQPTTVAFMLELLRPKLGQRILDVGSGSGWTTALLAHIVGSGGKVYGFERIPELVRMGQQNIAPYSFIQATIMPTREELGYAKEAPFDRILVSASAKEIPNALIEQLALGGIMVIPVVDAIYRIQKHKDGSIEKTRYEGFAFVPLITK